MSGTELLKRNFLEEFQHLHSLIMRLKRESDAIHFRKIPGKLGRLRWWNTRMPRWIVTRSPWQMDAVIGPIVPTELQLALVEQWKSFFGAVYNCLGHLSKFYETSLPHEEKRGRRWDGIGKWLGMVLADQPLLEKHVEILRDAVELRNKIVVHPSGTGKRVFDWLTMEACIDELCLIVPVWFSDRRHPDVPLIAPAEPEDDDFRLGPYAESFIPPIDCAEYWVPPWPPHVLVAFAHMTAGLTEGSEFEVTWAELAPAASRRKRRLIERRRGR